MMEILKSLFKINTKNWGINQKLIFLILIIIFICIIIIIILLIQGKLIEKPKKKPQNKSKFENMDNLSKK